MSFIKEKVTIRNTENHVIFSDIVNDEYKVSVALPNDYYDSNKSYPVIYVLDSNIFFGLTVDTARLLQFGKEIPELIIVGIGYPNDNEHMLLRNRDYLPTFNKISEKSGEAKKFLEFITLELIPLIDDEYRIDISDRAILGDSYSGLFALYVLFNNPKIFNRYVIGSPSIYWDNEIIFKHESRYANENVNLNAKAFLSVGELEAIYEPEFAKMVDNVVSISETLKSRNYKELDMTTHIFEGETHVSVIPATISRGLRVIYKESKI